MRFRGSLPAALLRKEAVWTTTFSPLMITVRWAESSSWFFRAASRLSAAGSMNSKQFSLSEEFSEN